MNRIYAIALVLIGYSCGMTLKSAGRAFREKQVVTITNVDDAIRSKKKTLLFLVFNNGDSIRYNSSVTTLLQIDTAKKDLPVYRCLADNYAVIKLYRAEFDTLLEQLDNYTHADNFRSEASAYNPGEAFLFISPPGYMELYGAMPLSQPKSTIHDLIWVAFGP